MFSWLKKSLLLLEPRVYLSQGLGAGARQLPNLKHINYDNNKKKPGEEDPGFFLIKLLALHCTSNLFANIFPKVYYEGILVKKIGEIQEGR